MHELASLGFRARIQAYPRKNKDESDSQQGFFKVYGKLQRQYEKRLGCKQTKKATNLLKT